MTKITPLQLILIMQYEPHKLIDGCLLHRTMMKIDQRKHEETSLEFYFGNGYEMYSNKNKL